MIALLMAGQHTSSATGLWILPHPTQKPEVVEELYQATLMVPDTPCNTRKSVSSLPSTLLSMRPSACTHPSIVSRIAFVTMLSFPGLSVLFLKTGPTSSLWVTWFSLVLLFRKLTLYSGGTRSNETPRAKVSLNRCTSSTMMRMVRRLVSASAWKHRESVPTVWS